MLYEKFLISCIIINKKTIKISHPALQAPKSLHVIFIHNNSNALSFTILTLIRPTDRQKKEKPANDIRQRRSTRSPQKCRRPRSATRWCSRRVASVRRTTTSRTRELHRPSVYPSVRIRCYSNG